METGVYLGDRRFWKRKTRFTVFSGPGPVIVIIEKSVIHYKSGILKNFLNDTHQVGLHYNIINNVDDDLEGLISKHVNYTKLGEECLVQS